VNPIATGFLPRLVSIVLSIAPSAVAQAPTEKIVATVNGEAITASDVLAVAPGTSGDVFDRALRGLVVEKRIDQEVLRTKISIEDERLAAALQDRIRRAGGKVGYAKFLNRVGITPEKDRQELRKQLAADRLIAEALGEVPGSPNQRPELARSIRVTDREVQQCYRENKSLFQRPGVVKAWMLQASAAKFENAEAAHQALEAMLEEPDLTALRAAIAADERFSSSEQSLDDKRVGGLIDVLRSTAETGATGARSGVADTDSGSLALIVLERQPPVELSFEDAAEVVKGYLVMQHRQAAVAKYIEALVAEATIWPPSLFESKPQSVESKPTK